MVAYPLIYAGDEIGDRLNDVFLLLNMTLVKNKTACGVKHDPKTKKTPKKIFWGYIAGL